MERVSTQPAPLAIELAALQYVAMGRKPTLQTDNFDD
jgi:hypothetical protein